jgi:hypothetical protein
LAPGPAAGRFFARGLPAHDKGADWAYIRLMRTLLLVVSLCALLALAVWFAGTAWVRLGGEPMPVYGYVVIAGGVLFSLLVGGGLMGLVFYSSRHGYDEGHGDARLHSSALQPRGKTRSRARNKRAKGSRPSNPPGET